MVPFNEKNSATRILGGYTLRLSIWAKPEKDVFTFSASHSGGKNGLWFFHKK
jgi:hypothetical protein